MSDIYFNITCVSELENVFVWYCALIIGSGVEIKKKQQLVMDK